MDWSGSALGAGAVTAAGAGAAGGLGFGLMAFAGARLQPGFDLFAQHSGLAAKLRHADLVITGEGFLDQESFNGKVVGGVHQWAGEARVPVVAIVGQRDSSVELPDGIEVRSLAERHGMDASMERTVALVADEVRDVLARLS